MSLLLAGLGIYWAGDMLDGWLARRLDQETRIGAVADILCDRLSAVPFYVGLVWLDSTLAVPVGVYLAEFLVVDLLLSLAFWAWPLVSPNYFSWWTIGSGPSTGRRWGRPSTRQPSSRSSFSPRTLCSRPPSPWAC